MKNSIEQIEDFLAGRLSPKEEAAFESKMEAEPEFARDVEAQRQAYDMVDMYTKIRMKEKVKAIHHKAKTSQGFFKGKSYLIAASISILIIVSCFHYAKTNFSNQALIANNIQPIALDQRNISNNGQNEVAKNLKAAVDVKNYDQAIKILSSAPKSSSYNWEQYYLGNLYLQVKKPNEAIAVFHALIESGDIRYLEDAQWLLVIAHLQNDDEEQAILSLDQIIQNPGHSLHIQAVEMRKRLNSLWRKMVF